MSAKQLFVVILCFNRNKHVDVKAYYQQIENFIIKQCVNTSHLRRIKRWITKSDYEIMKKKQSKHLFK